MTFQYFTSNQAFAIVFGDTPIRIGDENLFFATRADAKRALALVGLRLTNRNTVKVLEA